MPARGHGEDANARIGGAERADHFDPIAAGHEDVDERDVRAVLFEQRDGLNAVGRFDHFVTGATQHGAKDASCVVVVIGD